MTADDFQIDRFAVADFETDPFADWQNEWEQKVPKVFCAGLLFRGETFIFWGRDCIRLFIAKCIEISKTCPGIVIYFHNGGNFDFHFFLNEVQPLGCEFLCIGKRIVVIKTPGFGPEFRDSYALVPKALKTWDKDEFDYSWLLPSNREIRKCEIISYLKGDLRSLHGLMTEARLRNGRDFITLAGASFHKLKESLKPEKFKPTFRRYDRTIRPYYFAGRVQCFTPLGPQRGDYDVYDINSAFPASMLRFHWWGDKSRRGQSLPRNPADIGPCFIEHTCESKGHLPLRNEGDSVEYPVGRFRFKSTGWEFLACLELDLISNIEIHEVLEPLELMSYEDFVLPLYDEKLNGLTKADRYFSKLELNSSYGKTGQDPEHFRDICCTRYGVRLAEPWSVCFDDEENGLTFHQRPTYGKHNTDPMLFNNVAIAASITGKVRADLLRAIIGNGAVYCDTDSIIVPKGKATGLAIGAGLGEWKHEFTTTELHIGGKKLYAAKGSDPKEPDKVTWKSACKGVRLTPEEIVRVCAGEKIRYNFAAPSFSLFSGTKFISRVTRRQDLLDEE